jgi:Flp pilus assembly protein TadD
MDRTFVRTAAIVVCAAWAAGCGSVLAADQAAPAGASTSAPTATLEGEIARAHDLRVKGSYQDAARALSQLMLIAPDDSRVVGEYGKVLAQEGRSADAVPFLERAVQLQANDWTLYSALGVAYDQSDNHAKARTAYERALALKPGAPEVLNNYAVSRMLAGDLDGAQRYLAQASQAGSGNPKIAANLAILAGMRPTRILTAAPERLAAQAPDYGPRQALGTPKTLVVMQRVPVDPKAGPVARHAPPRHVLAQTTTHKPKPAGGKLRQRQTAAVAAPMPALRTAADGQ